MENGGWRNCTAFSSNHRCLFKDLRNKTEYQIRVRAFNKKGPGQWADIAETTDLIGKYSILILLYYTKAMATLWYSIIITFLQLPFRFISILRVYFMQFDILSSSLLPSFSQYLHSFSN